MLTLPPTVRIFVAAEPVDLRKGFDGLAGATRTIIRQNPLSGHLFIFINRRADQTTYCIRRQVRDRPLPVAPTLR